MYAHKRFSCSAYVAIRLKCIPLQQLRLRHFKIDMIIDKAKKNEFLRFCCVGCIAAAIDVAVFNIFKFFAIYQICVVMGFVISWLCNYFLSARWTFREKPTKQNFVGMLIAHLVNLLVVRMGLMYLLVDVLGINERIAYVPTLVIAAVTSFIMVRFAFKNHK